MVFRGSGGDITIINGEHYGGILIREIAKVSTKGDQEEFYMEKEIHGPFYLAGCLPDRYPSFWFDFLQVH